LTEEGFSSLAIGHGGWKIQAVSSLMAGDPGLSAAGTTRCLCLTCRSSILPAVGTRRLALWKPTKTGRP